MGMFKKINDSLPWNVYAKKERELEELAQSFFGERGIYKDDRYERYDAPDFNPTDFDLEVYDKMLKDGQVKAAMDMIKLSCTAKGFNVSGTDEETNMYADFINENFENIKGNVEDVLGEMLTALEYGFSATEKVFAYEDGKVVLKKLKVLDPHHLSVKTDRFGDIQYVVQHLGAKEIKIKPDKIMWYAYDKKFGNAYGNSALRVTYKHWYMKDKMYRFANIAYERYGTPLLVGQVQDAKDVDKMSSLLSRINSMSGLAISGGDKIESVQGSNADFIGYIEHHDRKIMESLLVPPMMLGLSRGQSGSYAMSSNQFDIFMIRLEALQRDLKSIMEEEVIRPLIDLNFPNVKKYPNFNFKPIADKDAEKLAKVFETMINLDVASPTEEWIREELGFPQITEEARKEIEQRRATKAKEGQDNPQDKEKAAKKAADDAEEDTEREANRKK